MSGIEEESSETVIQRFKVGDISGAAILTRTETSGMFIQRNVTPGYLGDSQGYRQRRTNLSPHNKNVLKSTNIKN